MLRFVWGIRRTFFIPEGLLRLLLTLSPSRLADVI